jgi:hypothetical protein
VTRHAGVLGLAAIAHPYSIPPRLLGILIRPARHVPDASRLGLSVCQYSDMQHFDISHQEKFRHLW